MTTARATPPVLEEAGHLPLSDVLALMQNRIMTSTTYFGVPTLKNPLDFWVYQEIVVARRPDVIVEIGTNCGGSALALAHLLDHLGHGRVLAVDIDHSRVHPIARAHERITFIEGDACGVYAQVRGLIAQNDTVLVIEDSAHTYDHTLAVLETYSALLHTGDVFIVEDGICHHGLDAGPSPGPYEAIEAFVAANSRFVIDRSKESFLVTWNPKGYLVCR